MSNKQNSGHSLVSDVTPWWWSSNWERKETRNAMLALLATKKFDFERIHISRESLRVELALGAQEDVNRTQDRVNALKAALDEMVAA